jgi:hypothetical protein
MSALSLVSLNKYILVIVDLNFREVLAAVISTNSIVISSKATAGSE